MKIEFLCKNKTFVGSNVVYRVFATPHVLKAVLIGCALQIFQQTSGVNIIEYFINNLFKSAGIEKDNDSLWLAVGPSGTFFRSFITVGDPYVPRRPRVPMEPADEDTYRGFDCIGFLAIHFMCTFIPMYLIETKGRRMLLMASVAGCALSMFFMAWTFLMMNKTSAKVLKGHENAYTNVSVMNFELCNGYRQVFTSFSTFFHQFKLVKFQELRLLRHRFQVWFLFTKRRAKHPRLLFFGGRD